MKAWIYVLISFWIPFTAIGLYIIEDHLEAIVKALNVLAGIE